jgi:hypothetical protein
MKFAIILLTLSIFTQFMSAQNPPSKSDSIYLENQIEEMNKYIEKTMKKVENNVQSKIDSLQKELLYYQVKEDYYSDALVMQTSIFIVIITIGLTILSLLSWKYFKFKLNEIKEDVITKVRDQNNKIDKINEDINLSFREVYGTAGNLYAQLGKDYIEKNRLFFAITLLLWSGLDYCKAYLYHIEYSGLASNPEGRHGLSAAKMTYTLLLTALDKIKDDKVQLADLKNKADEMLASLSTLSNIKDNKLMDLLAEVRTKINNCVKA